jgi:two-component system cell cycle sensor histidine kinase/response regulator CckA
VAAAAPTPGGSETILLVEDEAVVLRLLQLILTRAGYTVLIATSGADAQRTWQEHHEKIDMLMTDMVMPGGFSGKQVAEKLKAQNPALRVIFMSGYSQDLRNCGMDIVTGLNFIQKPFSRSAILQVVRRQLDSRG